MALLRNALFVCLAAAAGFLYGLNADRVARQFRVGSADRPIALESAWRVSDDPDPTALRRALASLGDVPLPTPAFQAERDLLQAIAANDTGAVEVLARTYAALPAGAIALAWLIRRAPPAAERARLIAVLRQRYPVSWLLETRDVREAAGR